MAEVLHSRGLGPSLPLPPPFFSFFPPPYGQSKRYLGLESSADAPSLKSKWSYRQRIDIFLSPSSPFFFPPSLLSGDWGRPPAIRRRPSKPSNAAPPLPFPFHTGTFISVGCDNPLPPPLPPPLPFFFPFSPLLAPKEPEPRQCLASAGSPGSKSFTKCGSTNPLHLPPFLPSSLPPPPFFP